MVIGNGLKGSVFRVTWPLLIFISVGTGVMFFGLSVRRVRPFIRTDVVATISHERFEPSG